MNLVGRWSAWVVGNQDLELLYIIDTWPRSGRDNRQYIRTCADRQYLSAQILIIWMALAVQSPFKRVIQADSSNFLSLRKCRRSSMSYWPNIHKPKENSSKFESWLAISSFVLSFCMAASSAIQPKRASQYFRRSRRLDDLRLWNYHRAIRIITRIWIPSPSSVSWASRANGSRMYGSMATLYGASCKKHLKHGFTFVEVRTTIQRYYTIPRQADSISIRAIEGLSHLFCRGKWTILPVFAAEGRWRDAKKSRGPPYRRLQMFAFCTCHRERIA